MAVKRASYFSCHPGILLYGPPGTGKTLMARQIGKMLNGKEPKIVNGPEILNKYVGQSEENIRNLFKEAEAEYKERGMCHSIILAYWKLNLIPDQETTATCTSSSLTKSMLSALQGISNVRSVMFDNPDV